MRERDLQLRRSAYFIISYTFFKLIITKKTQISLNALLWQNLHVCATMNSCTLLKFTENLAHLVYTQNNARIEKQGFENFAVVLS